MTEPIEDKDSELTEDLEVTEEEAEDVKGGMMHLERVEF